MSVIGTRTPSFDLTIHGAHITIQQHPKECIVLKWGTTPTTACVSVLVPPRQISTNRIMYIVLNPVIVVTWPLSSHMAVAWDESNPAIVRQSPQKTCEIEVPESVRRLSLE